MARISNDEKRENKDYGDSSQLTNWILDSGATCHMTPEVMDFIPGSLEDADKFIEVADGHHVTSVIIWHVAPESKIQLVNCELSP